MLPRAGGRYADDSIRMPLIPDDGTVVGGTVKTAWPVGLFEPGNTRDFIPGVFGRP